MDVRMEQSNKIVKGMWRSLGANIGESSAARMANTVDEVEALLSRIDKDSVIWIIVLGIDQKGSQKKLCQIQAFKYCKGRKGHPTYPNFPQTLLPKLDYRDLHGWMTDLIKTWYTVYKYAND